MALNIRTITPELHHRLKLAAFSSGVALDRFCVDILTTGVAQRTEQGTSNPIVGGSTPSASSKSQGSSAVELRPHKTVVRGSNPRPETNSIVDTRPRQSHDIKTCRIYGCLMCKMAKEK